MSSNAQWTYRTNQELPWYAVAWSDRDGDLIDFSTGYTFTVKLAASSTGTVALTKTTGIVGASTSPNVTVMWDTDELDITPGSYRVVLTATDGDGDDRVFRPGNEPFITIVEGV